MPELPEVETIRRQLAPRIEGRSVVDAGAFPSDKFTPATDVIGQRFGSPRRRGKYLLVPTDDGRELVIHLGMTGQLLATAQEPDLAAPHLRAWWQLDLGWLSFVDIRRFGRLRVVPQGDYSDIPTLHNAGPEPWDPALTAETLARSISSSKRPLKTQLLSQRPIAGVGNIYADEALWDAGIHPRATRLGVERAAKLLKAIQRALEAGLADGGTTLSDYRTVEGDSGNHQNHLAAYGRADLPCLRCNTPLRSTVIDARTSTYCPRCQRI